MKPSAKIIADSITLEGDRLTTMEVVMHRFILAEFNTHRAFSRNSASSRAIPFHKILARVSGDPAFPIYWGKEITGMQSGGPFTDPEIEVLKDDWEMARHYASHYAEILAKVGLHKSLVNRLLEPFMWHTAIVSATEWDNFFHQRCSPLAQPEMKALADQMQIAYFTSTPRQMAHGEWHLPYIKLEDYDYFRTLTPKMPEMEILEALKQISTARCARVSYLTHDGIRDLNKDLQLYNDLRGNGHWSPFEHVATPVARGNRDSNFIGWKQFRKEFLHAENFTNFIPNVPELAHITMKMEAMGHAD